MHRTFGHRLLICGCVLAIGAAATRARAQSGTAPTQTLPLPTELADSTFWRMINTFSEPEQPFTTYLVSNENQYPNLVRSLVGILPQSGAYIGVAPEQNYHYIAAIRPQIAFVIDIRRQAVMQHLMFKAVFELSPTRADFISLLFTKPRPAGLSDTLTAYQTWDAFWNVTTDTTRYRANLARIMDHLTKTHHLALTAQDSALVQYTYNAFYSAGPNLMANGNSGAPTVATTFANLTSAVDANGVERSFLATNAAYQTVRALHLRNLVIPVVGDIAGQHALRSIGRFLAEHATPVTAFYVSNVETYLGRDGKMPGFQANVAMLPTHPQSVLLRGISPMTYCNIQKWVASVFTQCF